MKHILLLHLCYLICVYPHISRNDHILFWKTKYSAYDYFLHTKVHHEISPRKHSSVPHVLATLAGVHFLDKPGPTNEITTPGEKNSNIASLVKEQPLPVRSVLGISLPMGHIWHLRHFCLAPVRLIVN